MSDEYIRRQDASNWLKQYGQDVLHGKYKFSLMYIWKNIMDLPSADVTPVVRCKDCKYWNNGNVIIGCYWDVDYPHEENDFCSHGERREE